MVGMGRRLLLATAIAWAGVLVAGAGTAMETEDCQDCHGDLSVVEEGGGFLYVDPEIYDNTAHAEEGCPACHDGVSDDHPDDGQRPSRAHCSDCHDGEEADIEDSAHAGNAACVDCHDPHQALGVAGVSGLDMNQACFGCHDLSEVSQQHASWLLQTDLHLRAVPCVSCHTASDDYAITFYLERRIDREAGPGAVRLADRETLLRLSEGVEIDKMLDADANGEVAVGELQEFIRWARHQDLGLWGMMTPLNASHRFDTLDNRWDCSFCHEAGEQSVNKSFIALPGADGRYQRLPLEYAAVVADIYGTTDFYMVGATRNPTLSLIGFGIIGGGLLVPLVHGTARVLTRKNRKEG